MQNLRRALLVAAVLTALMVIGATRDKSASTSPPHCEKATLAGGCFWGLQEALRQIPGVIKTTAGYTGGMTANPTYEQVASGKTGHAEAVEVVFDPAKLSYEQLLTVFLTARNPTRPSSSAGASSRSAIFFHNEGQRQTAERVKDKINLSGKWSSPVVTEITQATEFFPAEEYHQDYLRKDSKAHTCDLGKE